MSISVTQFGSLRPVIESVKCCQQAITFRSESEMVASASKMPVGSLAFVVSDELLFLRVQRGLREIQVEISAMMSVTYLLSLFAALTA